MTNPPSPVALGVDDCGFRIPFDQWLKAVQAGQPFPTPMSEGVKELLHPHFLDLMRPCDIKPRALCSVSEI